MIGNPFVYGFAGLLVLSTAWFAVGSVWPEDFYGNLMPELIGFGLEGMFFIGIFNWLQERKELERKNELRQSLSGALGFICQIINGALPPAEQVSLDGRDTWANQARTTGRSIAALEKRLKETELDLDPGQIEAIRQVLRPRLETMNSLLAVSAQLSHAHLAAYNLILVETHKIAAHDYFESSELKTSFENLLRLLRGFNLQAM